MTCTAGIAADVAVKQTLCSTALANRAVSGAEPSPGTLRVERRHCGSLCGSLDMSLWVCSGCFMLHPIIVLYLFCFVLAVQALPARTAQQDLFPGSLRKDF